VAAAAAPLPDRRSKTQPSQAESSARGNAAAAAAEASCREVPRVEEAEAVHREVVADTVREEDGAAVLFPGVGGTVRRVTADTATVHRDRHEEQEEDTAHRVRVDMGVEEAASTTSGVAVRPRATAEADGD
jgi:hypothetical protein